MPIDVAGSVFLVVIGVLLPWGAIRSARVLRAGTGFPRRRRFYLATLVQQTVMVLLALWAAHTNGTELFPGVPLRGRDVGLAGALLAGLLVLLPWRWRAMDETERARLLPLLPRTPREKLLYTVLALVAGIGEELVYRGTMFALLVKLTGNPGVAAALAAASFAAGHAVQGRATAALVGLVALAFQGLAAVSGALYAGMTVHVLFDLVVGLYGGRFLGDATFAAPAVRTPVHDPGGRDSRHEHQLPADEGRGGGASGA